MAVPSLKIDGVRDEDQEKASEVFAFIREHILYIQKRCGEGCILARSVRTWYNKWAATPSDTPALIALEIAIGDYKDKWKVT